MCHRTRDRNFLYMHVKKCSRQKLFFVTGVTLHRRGVCKTDDAHEATEEPPGGRRETFEALKPLEKLQINNKKSPSRHDTND